MTDQQPTIYDESFTVKKQRWGTFVSYDLEGKGLITSLTEELCVNATRWYLKAKQDGFDEPTTKYEGAVGGKL
jgi:hypothetical protein